MALYKHKQYLNDSDHKAFDLLQQPGGTAPDSGIYRCEACGSEVVAEKSKALPPRDHHIHAEEWGPIRWRLVVLVEPHGGLGVAVESKGGPARLGSRALAMELDVED